MSQVLSFKDLPSEEFSSLFSPPLSRCVNSPVTTATGESIHNWNFWLACSILKSAVPRWLAKSGCLVSKGFASIC